MKKLLIAMTAAAVGTCAWADGEAEGGSESTTTTYFNEQFTNWQNGEGGYVTSVAAPWSYGTVTVDEGDNATLVPATPAADELKVVNGALALNTGSKVLRGAFAAESIAIPDNNLFFNATVAFKDPSDTLPTLTGSDKFAIVALDNIESLELGLTNVTTKAATNLWVIAHHKTDGKRAYRLTGNLDSKWFKDDEGNDVSHTIVVKAYNNVVGTRAGFLVMLDNQICRVLDSYAISSGNVIDFKTAVDGSSTYLGYASTEVSLSERYGKGHLLLSLVSNSSLSSVDFQGQGVIDELSLADAGADFGPDVTAKTVTFTGYDSTGIVSISADLVNGVYTIPNGTAIGDITFAVTLESDYRLKATGATVAGTAPNYTVTYAYNGADTHTIELDVFKPAAMVNGVEVSATDFASILTALKNNQGTSTYEITLNDNVVTPIEIGKGQTLVLDLNGKTVADIYNEGTLTIDDSSVAENGTVLANQTEGCSVFNDGGVLTILGGCFEGAIDNEEGTVSISGGKFKDTNGLEDALDDGLTFSEKDDNDYYSVVTKTVTPLPDLTLPENATAEQEKTAVEAALGTQADAAVKANITNKTEYAAFKTWAGTNGGAATVVASVNAWVAYALDNAGLLDDAKVTLTDNDITVESFGQAENAAAGQFTLEISLKDVAIGNATTANLLKIFEAVGTTDLKAAFTAGAVTTDVVAANGKAKFTVAPSAATKPNAFFFKAQIKK